MFLAPVEPYTEVSSVQLDLMFQLIIVDSENKWTF